MPRHVPGHRAAGAEIGRGRVRLVWCIGHIKQQCLRRVWVLLVAKFSAPRLIMIPSDAMAFVTDAMTPHSITAASGDGSLTAFDCNSFVKLRAINHTCSCSGCRTTSNVLWSEAEVESVTHMTRPLTSCGPSTVMAVHPGRTAL